MTIFLAASSVVCLYAWFRRWQIYVGGRLEMEIREMCLVLRELLFRVCFEWPEDELDG